MTKKLTNREKLDILEYFDEGTELSDITKSVLAAARTLYGIAEDPKPDILVSIAQELIYDYIKGVEEYGDKYQFEEIDEEVYKLVMGQKKPVIVSDSEK